MKLGCIADPITAKGLKLAGVKEAQIAEEEEEAKAALEELLEDGEVGIMILTEDLAEKSDETISEKREKKDGIIPIIIEVPGREGPIPERREVIDKLVKRAVGINVQG